MMRNLYYWSLVLAFVLISFACDSGGGGEVPDEDGLCGGPEKLTCFSGFLCQYPQLSCGSSDDFGTCIKQPSECRPQSAPICGCDGSTYINSCEALKKGVTLFANRSCRDFVMNEAGLCGGAESIPCQDGLFCKFPQGSCGGSNKFGRCTSLAFECPIEPGYVCGCDGETYQNSCYADAAGQSIAYNGTC